MTPRADIARWIVAALIAVILLFCGTYAWAHEESQPSDMATCFAHDAAMTADAKCLQRVVGSLLSRYTPGQLMAYAYATSSVTSWGM